MVRALASQSVDLRFISLVESHQTTLKNGIHSFHARHLGKVVENKLASLLVVSLDKTLLQPLQLQCIHTHLSRRRDLATKCHMSTKILQTTNRKSSTALLTSRYLIYRTHFTLVAIMIEVTRLHTECTLLILKYSQILAVALQHLTGRPPLCGGRWPSLPFEETVGCRKVIRP